MKKATGKKYHQEQVKEILEHEAKKPKQICNEKEIKDLFTSHMHMMIQDIKEATLLSDWANLLATRVDANTVDQKMADFNAQIDLTHHEELPLPEEVLEDKFEVVLTSDEEEEEDEKEEEEWIIKDREMEKEGEEEDEKEEEDEEEEEDEKEEEEFF